MSQFSGGQTSANDQVFISFQLSFSTADVERSIFFDGEAQPDLFQEKIPDTTILIIHGDPYVLHEAMPQSSIPLSEDAGIFHPLEMN